jgi:hypothetical protein
MVVLLTPHGVRRIACVLLLGALSGCRGDKHGIGHGPGRADQLTTLWRDLGLPPPKPPTAWSQFWGDADVRMIAISSPPTPTPDSGSVTRFIRSRTPQLRYCYVERGLKRYVGLPLQGELTVGLAFGEDGAVRQARVLDRSAAWTEPAGSPVEACVLERVTAWRIPGGFASSGIVRVRWLFVPPLRPEPIRAFRSAGAT